MENYYKVLLSAKKELLVKSQSKVEAGKMAALLIKQMLNGPEKVEVLKVEGPFQED